MNFNIFQIPSVYTIWDGLSLKTISRYCPFKEYRSKCICKSLNFLSALLEKKLPINVPVVYMARDVMILMRAIPFRGPLEGVGPESRDFLGPEMVTTSSG
jgi:hypothetical protein